MEVDRVRKVADMIEAHPEHFDMGWFLSRYGRPNAGALDSPRLVGEVDLLSCGMTACIGGWVVGTWPAEVGAHEDIIAATARILGLPLDDAWDLCHHTPLLADEAAALLRGMADDYEAASA